MIRNNAEKIHEEAADFRAKVASQEWDAGDEQLVEAIFAADDTVVSVLGQMSAYHGTLPSLVEGIREHGLRGDHEVLSSDTRDLFNTLLDQNIDTSHPHIAQSLRLHYDRPDKPVYIATDKSTAAIYGFPEASRFMLQGLVHVSQYPATPATESETLIRVVNEEVDRLLLDDGNTTTAVVEFGIEHPTLLKSLTSAEHLARLSEAVDYLERRTIARALAQHNLPVYGVIPATAITDVDYVERTAGTWREIILSGRGQSVFM